MAGIDWPAFFTRAEVLEDAEARIADIPSRLLAMRETSPSPNTARQCSAPYECAYWDSCAGDKPADWILRLPRLSEDGAERLRAMGIETVSAISLRLSAHRQASRPASGDREWKALGRHRPHAKARVLRSPGRLSGLRGDGAADTAL